MVKSVVGLSPESDKTLAIMSTQQLSLHVAWGGNEDSRGEKLERFFEHWREWKGGVDHSALYDAVKSKNMEKEQLLFYQERKKIELPFSLSDIRYLKIF